MDTLQEIQKWYLSQCNDDWEHQNGVSIDTLDNPGWRLEINLNETDLENVIFNEVSKGITKDSETSGDNWYNCKVENNKFIGHGGPHKLEEILNIFLKWSNSNA